MNRAASLPSKASRHNASPIDLSMRRIPLLRLQLQHLESCFVKVKTSCASQLVSPPNVLHQVVEVVDGHHCARAAEATGDGSQQKSAAMQPFVLSHATSLSQNKSSPEKHVSTAIQVVAYLGLRFTRCACSRMCLRWIASNKVLASDHRKMPPSHPFQIVQAKWTSTVSI